MKSYSNVMLLKPIYFEFIYYLYLNELICRSLFRMLNKKNKSMIITDDKLINCIDLAFYYCLVSYYTNCVQHSSDKIAKFEFCI